MSMSRERYRDRLERLRGRVGAMADTVLDRYRTAVEVLETGDRRRAQRVIDGDDELNDWYLDIESDCIELLALQQPLAGDLRLVAASFKIVTDLERIGDLATNLAEYGRAADGRLFDTVTVAPIAADAGEMIADATDAYTRGDADTARAVAARDDALDRDCRATSEAVVREAMTTHAPDDALTAEDISRALLTVRDIERVGDHAVNICARTLYMVEQDDDLIY